jgi:uncharacterized membrane protein YdjX (TVP38/TMEM64 family)
MKSLLKPLLLALVLALAFFSIHLGWWGPVTEEVLLQRLFAQHWTVAWPIFILGSVVYTALGGPRQVLALSCGILFGGLNGALIGTLLTGLGAVVTMVAVQRLSLVWVRKRYERKIALIKAVLAEDTWLWVCVIRLMPVGSNLVTNIAAALSDLRLSAVFRQLAGLLAPDADFQFRRRRLCAARWLQTLDQPGHAGVLHRARALPVPPRVQTTFDSLQARTCP